MLRVDIYELVRERFQFDLCHHLVVHERAAAAVTVQFAADKVFAEVCLNHAAFFALGDGLQVGPSAHH